jgi:hypothetical protein
MKLWFWDALSSVLSWIEGALQDLSNWVGEGQCRADAIGYDEAIKKDCREKKP